MMWKLDREKTQHNKVICEIPIGERKVLYIDAYDTQQGLFGWYVVGRKFWWSLSSLLDSIYSRYSMLKLDGGYFFTGFIVYFGIPRVNNSKPGTIYLVLFALQYICSCCSVASRSVLYIFGWTQVLSFNYKIVSSEQFEYMGLKSKGRFSP